MLNKNSVMRDIMPVASPSPGRQRSAQKKEGKRAERRETPKTSFSFGIPKRPFGRISFPKARLQLVILAVLIYALFLSVVSFFAKAEIGVVLKNEPMDINKVFSASSAGADILAGQITFEAEHEFSTPTTATRDFSERASGRIVIYNAYSSESQSLVAITRFETSDGKIYRISKPLTVPGAKIVDGKIEPSSIEAEVFADKPGEDYNIGLADFTIPGFKGSAKFEKFYARSKTPMTGGFSGRARVVSQENADVLADKLKEELEAELTERMRFEVADEFLIPEGGYRFEMENLLFEPGVGERADEFRARAEAKLKVFFVKKNDIQKKLLEVYENDENFEHIYIPDFLGLKFEASEFDFEEITFNLKISGTADAVWGVDSGKLAEVLVSSSGSSERLKVFEEYSQIRRAEVSYSPSWWRVFPNDPKKVIINTSY